MVDSTPKELQTQIEIINRNVTQIEFKRPGLYYHSVVLLSLEGGCPLRSFDMLQDGMW